MKRPLHLLLILALACEDAGDGPLEPSTPEGPAPQGPAPVVRVSLGFGNVPVEGELSLSPPAGSENWRYEIDLDEDGRIDQDGILGLGIGFGYRFTTPGIHWIRTTLTGPEGPPVAVETPVIGNDEGPIHILATAQVPPVDPQFVSFEGITISHSGDALYVANYTGGSLHRIDPSDLAVTGVIEEMSYSIEGISVSPKDSFLFAAYKYYHAVSVDLGSFEIDRFFERSVSGKFFIQAVDERHALIGGEGSLGLVDMMTGETVRRFLAPGSEYTNTWHFTLSPDRTTAAVIVYDDAYSLHIVDAVTLQSLRTIPLGAMTYPRTLAFHPRGDRLYVIGSEEGAGALFAVFDLQSGEWVREVRLGGFYCSSYCVANPVATSLSGRYVAFEWSGGAYLIDTELDLPLHATPLHPCCGFSVTASPIEDVFYFLRSDGLIQKVTIQD